MSRMRRFVPIIAALALLQGGPAVAASPNPTGINIQVPRSVVAISGRITRASDGAPIVGHGGDDAR